MLEHSHADNFVKRVSFSDLSIIANLDLTISRQTCFLDTPLRQFGLRPALHAYPPLAEVLRRPVRAGSQEPPVPDQSEGDAGRETRAGDRGRVSGREVKSLPRGGQETRKVFTPNTTPRTSSANPPESGSGLEMGYGAGPPYHSRSLSLTTRHYSCGVPRHRAVRCMSASDTELVQASFLTEVLSGSV